MTEFELSKAILHKIVLEDIPFAKAFNPTFKKEGVKATSGFTSRYALLALSKKRIITPPLFLINIKGLSNQPLNLLKYLLY